MRESRLRAVRRGVFMAWVGLWAACASPPPPPLAPLPALQVEYAGCTEVFLPGPVCALGKKEEKRQIGLWVGQPPEVQIRVRVDGRRAKKGLLGLLGWPRPPGPEVSTAAVVAGGQRFTVDIPAGASAVRLRARTPRGEAVWSLQLTTVRRSPSSVRKAYQWWQEDRPADALRLLEAQIPALPRQERWLALRLRAEIAERQGVVSSKLVGFFEEAIAAERAAGALLSETKGATTLAWIHIRERRLDAARKVLSDLRLPAGSPAEAVYDWSFHYGLLAEESGDARTALAELGQAVERAERLNLVNGLNAGQVLGRQLQALGRSEDAAALFAHLRETLPPGLPQCDRARLLVNQAWSLLLAREAGEKVLKDPIPILRVAQKTFQRSRCLSEERRLNHQINLTLAYLQDGRFAEARAALAEARRLEDSATPLLRLWGQELEARLQLLEGKPQKALDLYGRLEELADSTSSPDGLWRAAHGRARCYRTLGRAADALAAYAAAEELLDQRSLQIPIQEGRETFAAQHEGATRSYLELLLAQGRLGDAFEAARRARSRVLRHLARENRLARLPPEEQRRWDGAIAEYRERRQALDRGAAEDWKLPADQLSRLREARAAQLRDAQRALDLAFAVLGEPDAAADLAPRPGEVVLAYHPLPEGWVGFAALGKTVAVHRFDLPETALERPAELGERLLAPFRAQIEEARRVRILPYGELREVDFHALPFGGDILLAARPVVYGLDLAAPGEGGDGASPGSRGGRRALVVANPSRDLPASEREAEAVVAALGRQRPAWSAVTLRQEQASAEAVRGELAAADLLHYAGHGIYSGFGGWESVLPLAGSDRLALGDVLALERVPPWVVLSGCETARSGGEAPAEGLSLAHAFLLAGSESVVAATRPVGDRAAEGLFTELYRRWGPEPDLAVLLQQAQLDWRRAGPRADWPSFRLYEP